MPQINDPGESQPLIAVSHIFRWTSDGRMGWIPEPGRGGDLVSILRGSAVPMILRQMDDGCQVISPFYMHGTTDGEAVEAAEAAGEPMQQIKLS